MLTLLRLLALASPTAAHIALWHPSSYGWEKDKPYGVKGVQPLSDLAFKEWWFHGYIDEPPEDGVFMELPSGGIFKAELACDKINTTWGAHYDPNPYRACKYWDPDTTNSGVLHSADPYDTPVEECKDLKGTAIAIAYEADVSKIKPDDFVVISTHARSPWLRNVDYRIPAGLPPCPPGGCHCAWGWVHSTKGGKIDEMYFLGYRCNVTNADVNATPLPAPRPAVKCVDDPSNCTRGPKQMHYWAQKEGNNNFQDRFKDPPYYNSDYGFKDGAQDDLWDTQEAQAKVPGNNLVADGLGPAATNATTNSFASSAALPSLPATTKACKAKRSRRH